MTERQDGSGGHWLPHDSIAAFAPKKNAPIHTHLEVKLE